MKTKRPDTKRRFGSLQLSVETTGSPFMPLLAKPARTTSPRRNPKVTTALPFISRPCLRRVLSPDQQTTNRKKIMTTILNHDHATQSSRAPQTRRLKQSLWIQWVVIAVGVIFLSVGATVTLAGPSPSPSPSASPSPSPSPSHRARAHPEPFTEPEPFAEPEPVTESKLRSHRHSQHVDRRRRRFLQPDLAHHQF